MRSWAETAAVLPTPYPRDRTRTLRASGDGAHVPTGNVCCPMPPNLLAYGDNLDVLSRHIKDESVDLVYLDPPFNSNADYNVLFAQQDGTPAAAQIKAFGDTWRWDDAAVASYTDLVEAGGDIAKTMQAFRTLLGRSDMLAYLSMIAPRLLELHRVLKATGSVFLHCDPTASHYLKILLDAVFGPKHFRNEIAWCYWGPGTPKQRQFSRKHDIVLWFTKGDEWTWNADAVRIPHAAKTIENYRTGLLGSGFAAGETGATRVLAAAGKVPEDWWPIAIAPRGKEYLGYPTQKPIKLLDRIIRAATNPDDVVLDPFCGCGTTIDAAQASGRRWIGIDVTHHAIGLIKHRLATQYGPEVATGYKVIGEPTTTEDAAILAKEDPYQFQAWALGLVGARTPVKPGGDGGIDGQAYFHDFDGGPTRRIVFSVKGGGLVPAFVRELRGVLDREAADIAVLISLNAPTGGMRAEAQEAGYYTSSAGRYPRLQLRTVGELLSGRLIDRPAGRKMTADQYEQARLFAEAEVPVVAKERRRRPSSARSKKGEKSIVLESPVAGLLRDEYSQRPANQEGPRSPRTSKRDRQAPLPSRESGDTD
jgi:DNA modification methylase